MSSDEEKKEITVNAPSKPALSPEKKSERAVEKSLEEERFGVLVFPRRISKYAGIVAVASGFLLVFLLVYVVGTGDASSAGMSSSAGPLGLVFWGFVGLVNVVVGLLLMGRD